jgi:hypothetical protein
MHAWMGQAKDTVKCCFYENRAFHWVKTATGTGSVDLIVSGANGASRAAVEIASWLIVMQAFKALKRCAKRTEMHPFSCAAPIIFDMDGI